MRGARTACRSAPALLLLVSACGGADGSGRGELEVVRDMIGDTVVVRTLSGSAWGADAHLQPQISIGELEGEPEYLFGQIVSLAVGADGTIYVVDRQAAELRAYAPDGTYLSTIGRRGEGPGEIRGPDGGLAVLSDGRILVRDRGNARIQVYTPDGRPAGTWPVRPNYSTSAPLFVDREDNVHTQVQTNPGADFADRVMGLARYAPDGTVRDTLVPPTVGYDAPIVEARGETAGGGRVYYSSNVPFSPSEEWTFLPAGYFVHGVSTAYRITLYRPGAPLRIERDFAPVPVAQGERAEEERRITRRFAERVPGWSWTGPPIPDSKPPFRGLYPGRDGRLWVWVWQPGVERDDPDHDPTDPNSLEDRWKEPVAFDVFEPDGTYLGHVTAPLQFSQYPTPVFDGDYVWAVTRDELDVQRVVRFRIVRTEET